VTTIKPNKPWFHEHIFIGQKWYQNVETYGALLQVTENYHLMVSSTTKGIVGLNNSKNLNTKLEQTYIRFILAHWGHKIPLKGKTKNTWHNKFGWCIIKFDQVVKRITNLKDSQNPNTKLDQRYISFVWANWSYNIPLKSKIEMPLA
jgi:hypothetical protein